MLAADRPKSKLYGVVFPARCGAAHSLARTANRLRFARNHCAGAVLAFSALRTGGFYMSLCEPLSSLSAPRTTDVLISAPALNRRAIRQIINRALGTPAELDAFLIDYFPEIYRLTSDAMNRDVKLNLLLWNTEEDQLRSQVEQSFPQQVKEVRTLLAELATSTDLPGDDPRKRFVVILSATIEEADRHQVVAILRHLRLYTSDAELTIEAVQSGSVILICTATDDAFHRLFEEFVVGRLPKLLHFPIADIYPAHLPPWRKRSSVHDPAVRRENEWAAASRSRPTEVDPERYAPTLRIERPVPWLLYALISFLVTVGIGLLLLSYALPRAFWSSSDWTALSVLAVADAGDDKTEPPPSLSTPRPAPLAVERVATEDLALPSDDDAVHPSEPSVLSPRPSKSALASETAAYADLEPEPAPSRTPARRHAASKSINKEPEPMEEFRIASFCNENSECQNKQISAVVKKCLINVQRNDIAVSEKRPIVLKKIGDRYFPYDHYSDEVIRGRIQEICTCVQEQLADNQPDLMRWPAHIWILPGS